MVQPRPTVLVADDDESIRDLLLLILSEAGYATLQADNGRTAVELAAEHRPDVALLDVMMPVMDGFEACRRIKSDPQTSDIPVLLLTALAQTGSKVQGLDDGATDYITKPFENLELLARLRAVVQEKSRRDALVAEALTDALTGLTNRRGLERQLDQLLAHSHRNGEPLSVLIFDADRFKSVNDTYGHETGDIVLATLARRAQESVRAEDVVGRFGGEEFLIILPGAGPRASYTAAERLRMHVATEPIVTPAGPIDITVSVGVATNHAGMEIDRAALVTVADTALYSAKRGGRNRVAHADGQPTAPLIMPEPPEVARALLAALELADPAAAGRAQRVAQLCWTIGGAMQLSPSERTGVALAGLLHNIGELAVRQPVLVAANGNGDGDADARWASIAAAEELLCRLPSLSATIDLVRACGEHWDGSGGPRGLRGEAIPLGSRIIAVAIACDNPAGGAPAPHAVAALDSRFDPVIAAAARRALA